MNRPLPRQRRRRLRPTTMIMISSRRHQKRQPTTNQRKIPTTLLLLQFLPTHQRQQTIATTNRRRLWHLRWPMWHEGVVLVSWMSNLLPPPTVAASRWVGRMHYFPSLLVFSFRRRRVGQFLSSFDYLLLPNLLLVRRINIKCLFFMERCKCEQHEFVSFHFLVCSCGPAKKKARSTWLCP